MAGLNTRTKPAPRYTYEGARAVNDTAAVELERAVMSCLLWENSFYESGIDIAERIANLVARTPYETVAEIATKARDEMNLRHVPLLLVREMARHPKRSKNPGLIADTLAHVIQRPDELTEFVAIYWKDGKKPLTRQMKKGLGRAFNKFNEYQLAKYNRPKDIRLRDVLFLAHAKPDDAKTLEGKAGKYTRVERKKFGADAYTLSKKEDLWRRLISDELEVPDTWEVALSGGADKRKTFERLINEGKLGQLALLRNLRNMQHAGVPKNLAANALADRPERSRVLPFRYIAAARAVPSWENIIEPAMLQAAEALDKLPGHTRLLLDVSGSMYSMLSSKSDMTAFDAAAGLAILLREIAEEGEIFTFSSRTVQVPMRRGFALRDAIHNSQSHSSTDLGRAVHAMNGLKNRDRLIVLTDEQSNSMVPPPQYSRAYMINVAGYKNSVANDRYWTRIDGFSENIVRYIATLESSN